MEMQRKKEGLKLKRTARMILSGVFTVGLLLAMSMLVQAKTYNDLKTGDIIRLGDSIEVPDNGKPIEWFNSMENYNQNNVIDGFWPEEVATLTRVDPNNGSDQPQNCHEDPNGKYYGYSYKHEESEWDFCCNTGIEITDDSDGLIVTKAFDRQIVINIKELNETRYYEGRGAIFGIHLKKVVEPEEKTPEKKESGNTSSDKTAEEKDSADKAAAEKAAADKAAEEKAAADKAAAEKAAAEKAAAEKAAAEKAAAEKAAAEKAAAEKTAQEKVTIAKAPAGVKAKGKKAKAIVSWKKIKKTKSGKKLLAQISYVQVQYATDPAFTQNVGTREVAKNKTKATLNLERKTVYYVRVRYVGSDGVSNWSKIKKVKTK